MKVGVLRNPFSTRNLKHPHSRFPDDVNLVEIGAEKSIADAVHELTGNKLDLLVIDGGDGTITTAIAAMLSSNILPPPIGIIANGNTNLIARKAGKPVTPNTITRLVEMSATDLRHHLKQTPLLLFTIEKQENRCGFIAGWGAYARGTRMAAEEMSTRQGAQVLGAIFATLRRSLFGGEAQILRAGIECDFSVDEQEIASETRRFVGVVTSLQGRLIAGIKPFWGSGEGAIRWLDVSAPPKYHIVLTPFLLFGFALPILSRFGYRSGRATRVSVTLSEEMIIDGEMISLPLETRVDIDVTQYIDFLNL